MTFRKNLVWSGSRMFMLEFAVLTKEIASE
jgi:hypothetical protein